MQWIPEACREDIVALYKECDTDRSGEVEYKELDKTLRRKRSNWNEKSIR